MEPKFPVRAYDDLNSFKTYLLDVGLLRKEFKLPLHAICEDKRIFTEHNGALTENFVLEHLVTQFDIPRFWYTLNPSRTIDFLIQKDNLIIPIEVKSSSSPRNKVLQKFAENYRDDISLEIRFTLDNLKLDGNLLNIPLFMACETKRMIELTLFRYIKKYFFRLKQSFCMFFRSNLN